MKAKLPIRAFPSTVYIPEGFPKPGDNEKTVRIELTWELATLQASLCPICCKPLHHGSLVDCHEGIISKGDVRGWPASWKVIIFNIYNCLVIHRTSCHESWPDRKIIWEMKCEMFGQEEVERWYYSLPMKRELRRF